VVDEIYGEYADSILTDDAERWIAHWTDDGVQLPPGLPHLVGRPSILAAFEEHFGTIARTEFVISAKEVQTAGEWAYAWGTFVGTDQPKEGGDVSSIDGKFLTIFQKQSDGSWKIHRDIFNSNVP
jgi:uncharacterized protein (TIGR02246 family)